MLARRDRDRSTHGRPPDSKGGSNRSYLGDLSWRGLRAVGPIHWSAAATWRGARVAVGVLVPLAIGSATGHLSYGAFAALGALPAGFASFQGVARTRLAAVSMASLGIAISTFVGATTAAVAPWLLVAVVIVWGYLIGLAVSLGQRLSVAPASLSLSGCRSDLDQPELEPDSRSPAECSKAFWWLAHGSFVQAIPNGKQSATPTWPWPLTRARWPTGVPRRRRRSNSPPPPFLRIPIRSCERPRSYSFSISSRRPNA